MAYPIWNTKIGQSSTASTVSVRGEAGSYPLIHHPTKVFDNNVTTKYFNYGNGAAPVYSTTKGDNTGLYITPVNSQSVLKAIQMATADDLQNRDPLYISIEGSNAPSNHLIYGSVWNLIYVGSTGLTNVTNRMTFGELININNFNTYDSYRILVQSQRGRENGVQYSELHLYGWF
ncbi:unnamed protein product [Adineta steineri]|uniref:Uncharacterized protein n=1 Tax=Adineta steineri TaxID=433720 RepID=A0A819KA37_9BILA|nr:unnamed protein product [Adineta steineri]CAF3943648.1 unnamed protein product [Adineta steineri]